MLAKSALVTVRLTEANKQFLFDFGRTIATGKGNATNGVERLIAHYRSFMTGNATPPDLLVDPKDLVESKHDDRIDEAGEDYSFGRNDGLAPRAVEQEPEKEKARRKVSKPGKSRPTPKPAAAAKNGRLKKGKK